MSRPFTLASTLISMVLSLALAAPAAAAQDPSEQARCITASGRDLICIG